MIIHTYDKFGSRVSQLLLDNKLVEQGREEGLNLLFVDRFNWKYLEQFDPGDTNSNSWMFVAKATNRVVISPLFSPKKICIECFLKRWKANIGSWDVSFEVESALQSLKSYDVEIESKGISDEMICVVVNIIVSKLKNKDAYHKVIVFNYLKSTIESYPVIPLHGCNSCFVNKGFNRYVDRLAEHLSKKS